MNVLYEIATDDRTPLELRYEAARKLQRIKANSPVNTHLTQEYMIRKEIGPEKLLYIINHYGKQDLRITAEKVGVKKTKLVAYHMALFGDVGGIA